MPTFTDAMPTHTGRRTVTAAVLGAAALGVLALPAVAQAATPDSIAGLADTGSGEPGAPAAPTGPGVLISKDRDGNVTVRQAEPGVPPGPDAVRALPLRPGVPAPGVVTVRPGDPGVAIPPGKSSQTIVVYPAR
ncbi:hypothetical protein ACIRRA_27970 [Nocardia sp. NPDC101769]|uniref:hypothetical protein n=1 Tax=Nocardia sp. NPDC101769 TaxID=3364333 RepID=UPI00380DF1A0